MAMHLITLILDDEYEDITSQKDLDDFVFELRGCTHAHLKAVSVVYNIAPSSSEDEED